MTTMTARELARAQAEGAAAEPAAPVWPHPRRLFWAVSASHFVVDSFAAVTGLLLAFISAALLPMSNTQIGFAIALHQLTAALCQPVVGLIIDRTGGRWAAAGGLALAMSMAVLALVFAQAGSYPLMVAAFTLSALGVGAFHPPGIMYAGMTSARRATGLSIFYLLGQSGAAFGLWAVGLMLDSASRHIDRFTAWSPILHGRLLEGAVLEPLMLVALVAVPFIVLMAVTVPNRRAFGKAAAAPGASAGGGRIVWSGLLLLCAVIALRSIVNPGIISFLPTLFQQKGWAPADYGLVTALWWLAGGISGVVFGQVGERWGARRAIALTLLAAAPVVFFLPTTEGGAVFALTLAAGALTGGSFSLIVALAQGMLPAQQGFAAGATQALIFGTGALGSLLIGALSDRVGLPRAFQWGAGALLITSLLAWGLPREEHGRA
jgi:MFS family permease